MNEKAKLLKRVQICDFVLLEMNEFLDTHPNDKEALAYFHKYKKMAEDARRDYTRQFGPLTANDVENTSTWDWIQDPWPWDLPKEV